MELELGFDENFPDERYKLHCSGYMSNRIFFVVLLFGLHTLSKPCGSPSDVGNTILVPGLSGKP